MEGIAHCTVLTLVLATTKIECSCVCVKWDGVIRQAESQTYHIVGNFRGRKLSQIGGKIEFHSGSEGERYVQRHSTMCQ